MSSKISKRSKLTHISDSARGVAVIAFLWGHQFTAMAALLTFVISALGLAVILLMASRGRTQVVVQSEGDQLLTESKELLKELNQLYGAFDPAITEDMEKLMLAQIERIPVPERQNWFVRIMVVSTIFFDYERVWAWIYGSQLNALHKLNEAPAKRQDLVPIYATAAQLSPGVYATYSFDQWIGFMRGQLLLREDGDEVSITRKGRDFLKYLVGEGKAARQKAH